MVDEWEDNGADPSAKQKDTYRKSSSFLEVKVYNSKTWTVNQSKPNTWEHPVSQDPKFHSWNKGTEKKPKKSEETPHKHDNAKTVDFRGIISKWSCL